MGSWRCLGCGSLTDELANSCSECSKKLDKILRSSQRVAESIQPNSPSLFASRVWTDCAGDDRRAGAALADVFFFGWLLDQLSSFRAAAALQLIGRYLPVPRIEIAGPQGVQATFDWQAAKATSPARMCTAVLVNTFAAY